MFDYLKHLCAYTDALAVEIFEVSQDYLRKKQLLLK